MRQYFTDHHSYKSKDIFVYLGNLFDIDVRTVESIVYNFSWKHVKTFPIVNKNKKLTTEDVLNIRYEMNNAVNKLEKEKN